MKASYTVAAVCLGAALLCGCGQQAALEEQTTDAQGTAAETTEQVLYHGGEPRTPEEVLAQALADTGRLDYAGIERLLRWLGEYQAANPEYDYE